MGASICHSWLCAPVGKVKEAIFPLFVATRIEPPSGGKARAEMGPPGDGSVPRTVPFWGSLKVTWSAVLQAISVLFGSHA